MKQENQHELAKFIVRCSRDKLAEKTSAWGQGYKDAMKAFIKANPPAHKKA